ncbi:MFS transporter [Bombilactobacillus thymidiniphilus]|uniref:MFS transporter n=1 Tax=Bombilactobacillus thymidiniphilus TaxID=2923363 RepID=A0ABY4PBI1_9LACO|nr:MFS transporter [Bombilactobacillus thymidiniphilus]UQS82994.1 MFS transporter [Bombilactobacillus thymidiniphilus]
MHLTKNRLSILVGIIALTTVTRLDSVMAPSIVKIQQAFPHADPTQVESIASIGDVASMIASFIFGFILTKITYKKAAVIGLTLLAAGGLLPIFIHQSVGQLIFFALIVGFGSGAITTVLPSLSAASYQGERRSNQFGFNVALEDGFAMVWIVLGGFLANISWVHNYYVYGITIVALILAWLFVPDTHPTDTNSQQTSHTSRNHWTLIISLIVISMLVEILVAVMSNKMAIYLHQYQIGGPSTSGQALLFVRAASIVAGILISLYRKTFGNYLLAAGFGAIVVGASLFIFFHAFWSSALGAFLIGTGGSVTLITVPFLLSNLASAKVYPIVMGTFSALTSLGFAFSAWFFKFTAPLFNQDTLIGTFEAMIALSAVIAIFLVVTNLQKRASRLETEA